MEAVAFAVLAVLAIVSAVAVITHRSAIVAALALAFNLVSIAGFFFMLHAQFIAVLQIIVYAGAIMVLILFVLMLLNIQDERALASVGFFQRLFSPALGLALAVIVLLAVGRGRAGPGFPPVAPELGTVGHVGRALYGRFFYPFEAISLLLVVAMVGAVLLAKKRL